MEMLFDGRVIAEVVPSDSYKITNIKQAQMTACGRKLSVQIMLTSDNDTLLVFENMRDMLTFDCHMINRLDEDVYGRIKRQHMTKNITYSYKFKPEDFEKYIRNLN
jgi:hypothetical protein